VDLDHLGEAQNPAGGRRNLQEARQDEVVHHWGGMDPVEDRHDPWLGWV